MSLQNRIVECMTEFGFTGSEAKLYLALLKKQPATGYELAASSGVPRSAIYALLKRLEEAGLINAVQAKPAKYLALNPDRLVNMLEGRLQTNLNSLQKSLENWTEDDSSSQFWQLSSYRTIIEQVHQFISSAQRSIVASLWEQEAHQLKGPLAEASERGVNVTLFSFTHLPDKIATTFYCYGIDESQLEAHWQRQLLMVIDEKWGIFSQTSKDDKDDKARGIITEDSGLLSMATNNIILDLTLFQQRTGIDTQKTIKSLESKFAPIDQLLKSAQPKSRRSRTTKAKKTNNLNSRRRSSP